MGSKLINKVLTHKTDSDALIELYETEDGDSILYASLQAIGESKLDSYTKLMGIVKELIDNESVKQRILSD
jgi:hypothetical protein